MEPTEKDAANRYLIQHLQESVAEGQIQMHALSAKLSTAYWLIIVLSLVTFGIGCLLLLVPVISTIRGTGPDLPALTAAGFGIVDLAVLFLFRPVEKVHGIMGDMAQITMAVYNFRAQVALRILAMDADDRPSIIAAADRITGEARTTIILVQKYFEPQRKLEQSKEG